MTTLPVEIRVLTALNKSSFEKGVNLLNETQGRNLFAVDYLEIRTADPLSRIWAAFEDEEIVGLGIAQVIDSFEYYNKFDPSLATELAKKKVGSFSTLCFEERFRAQGLGQKISHLRLGWLREQGCQVVLGISWVSGLAHTSDRVFQKMGFTAVKSVDNFFYDSSLKNPFECPGCGSPPCTCSAILYRRELS